MHIITAVAALGRQMGIDLKLNDAGVCSLSIGDRSSLFLERREDALAISLARKIPRDIMDSLARALELCHLKNNPRHDLRAALFRTDILVLACKLEKHHITAGMVAQVFPYLLETMDRVE